MSSENLWGEIPKTGSLKTPVAILREQAGLLGDATNNLLLGEVTTPQGDPFSSGFNSKLRIVAPALDNYLIEILRIEYPLALYPVKVVSLVGSSSVVRECNDETIFKAVLKDILSSARVHKVLDSLLSQSQAA